MEENKEITQRDELSRCLDRLNDGNYPVMEDKEIEELIEMAVVVKEAHGSEELPRVLIDEIVDTLVIELGGKKEKQRRHWLYGGVACAAASLFVAITTQFLLPQSFNQNISQEIDGNVEKQKLVAVVDQSSSPIVQKVIPMEEKREDIIESKPMGDEKLQSGLPAESTPSKSADSMAKVMVEILEVAQLTGKEEEGKNNQVAILEKETLQEKGMGRKILMARMDRNSALQDEGGRQSKPENTMFVQPGKVAKSVMVDLSSGVIRQVYNEGRDEIVITQRSTGDKMGAIAQNAQQGINYYSGQNLTKQPMDKKNREYKNSLTVEIDNYDITIEGNKSREELQKIVDSLVVKEMDNK